MNLDNPRDTNAPDFNNPDTFEEDDLDGSSTVQQ